MKRPIAHRALAGLAFTLLALQGFVPCMPMPPNPLALRASGFFYVLLS